MYNKDELNMVGEKVELSGGQEEAKPAGPEASGIGEGYTGVNGEELRG